MTSLFSPLLFFFFSSPFIARCQMLTMVAAVWKEGTSRYIGVRLILSCNDTAHEGKTQRVSKFARVIFFSLFLLVSFIFWDSFSFARLSDGEFLLVLIYLLILGSLGGWCRYIGSFIISGKVSDFKHALGNLLLFFPFLLFGYVF